MTTTPTPEVTREEAEAHLAFVDAHWWPWQEGWTGEPIDVRACRTVVALSDRIEEARTALDAADSVIVASLDLQRTQRECLDRMRSGFGLCPIHHACWYDGAHEPMTEAQRAVMEQP